MASVALTYIVTTATRTVYQARTHVLTVRQLCQPYRCLLIAAIEIDLPEYNDYETLRRQLYTAMTAGSEYFGFA